ncbi:hypothetical protein [Streptobacillus moniliformis]|uniref:hypothetical protein n=1 Tax=Streptobacillus moniliformis TaxID=34105 RepID=UPI0007E3A9D7|nr:hypothetical protein [Streptobacillus moniliformis]
MELIFGGIIFLYIISILILMERNIKLDELNEKLDELNEKLDELNEKLDELNEKELEKYFEKYL